MSINRVNPSTVMRSASLKFYLLCLLVICVIGWSAAVPLSRKELEERYRTMPPVLDERNADAELDNAYGWLPRRP
ncbi:uncharacterized protein LOC6533189 [Drosophila yakuba]|uniref:Uncharacterized protein n=1 Tax=Drosophila yakuba TaxID=7245 RepID=B4PJM8_DROYA|nr:uncharacterized protein LOC6533189 [Drosophila yakuba]EDW93627.1 uncharacterized protein Dyak_GE20492 [Drosophila yakuba]